MQDNQFEQKRKEGKIEVGDLTNLFSKENKETEPIEDIDYSKFDNVNMQALIASKSFNDLFEGIFTEQEIAEIVSKNQTTKESLSALAVACAYISKNEDQEFKARIKDAALKGNFDYVLEQVAIEKGKLITDDMIKNAIEQRIPAFLTNVEAKEGNKSLENKVTEKYAYSFEKLKGELGKGMRLEFAGQFYEHRNMDKNTVLRIIQNPENGKYEAIMHFGDVKKNNGFESMNHLANVVNSVFGTGYKIDGKDYKALRDESKQIILSPFSEWNQRTRNAQGFVHNLSVSYNLENNYLNKNDSLKALKQGSLVEARVSTVCGLVISGLAMRVPSLLGLAAPFFINSLAAYGGHGLITHLYKEDILNVFNRETFKDPTTIEELVKISKVAKKEREKQGGSGVSSETEALFDKRHKILDETFTNINLMQGYVVEFHSDSLDDLYNKAFAISERIKK